MKNNGIFIILLTLPSWMCYVLDLSPSKQRLSSCLHHNVTDSQSSLWIIIFCFPTLHLTIARRSYGQMQDWGWVVQAFRPLP